MKKYSRKKRRRVNLYFKQKDKILYERNYKAYKYNGNWNINNNRDNTSQI